MNKHNVKKSVNGCYKELKEDGLIDSDPFCRDEIKWRLIDLYYEGYNQAMKEVDSELNNLIKKDKSVDNKKALKLMEKLVKYG